jgi:RNA polymerase sigma-70 factor, ECF subfamily
MADVAVASIELKSVEPNELVRRVLGGCSDAATELSDRFSPRLILLLERRLSGRRSDAEDIAQESLSRAFARLNQFDSNYQFSTWLYTIAFRLAVDFLRKEKRRPKIYPIDEIEPDAIACQNRNQPTTSDLADDAWGIARTILVESEFTMMWLRYGEGLSIQEIATVVQKTQIGVRVQLHRSRIKLQKEICRRDREPTNSIKRQLPK